MEAPNSGSRPTTPPPPPAVPSHAVTSTPKKKRKFDDAGFQSSKYCKIRSLLKALRPSFIEVLRAPDYCNCKTSDTIRKELRLMMEMSKQLRTETVSMGKMRRPCETIEDPAERRQEMKPTENTPVETRPLDEKDRQTEPNEERASGSYSIGGSPNGWNFLLYPGSGPVYYGKTKATVTPKSEAAN